MKCCFYARGLARDSSSAAGALPLGPFRKKTHLESHILRLSGLVGLASEVWKDSRPFVLGCTSRDRQA